MGDPRPLTPLRELLARSPQTLQIDPLADYQEITVRLWGKGVVRRGYVKGSESGDFELFGKKSAGLIGL
jgi:type I restriction enzyme S subunit